MKPVAVMKKSGQKTWVHLEKGIAKPKKDYKKHLGRVLNQAQQNQSLWALDFLNGQNICSDDFRLIAAEAARLSHCRHRNTITRQEICSALTGLYPTRCQEHLVRDTLRADLAADQYRKTCL